MALLYAAMEQYAAKAETLYQPLLEDSRGKVLGADNHPDVADSLSNLAYLYVQMGEFAKAIPLDEPQSENSRGQTRPHAPQSSG